jgi:hypothetical protein
MDLSKLFNISLPFNEEKLILLEKLLIIVFSNKNNSNVIYDLILFR